MTSTPARLVVALSFVVLTSCESARPTEPGKSVSPGLVGGKYVLSAPGQTTSNMWETYPVQFEGILTLEQDPQTPSSLTGTFSRFRERDLEGTESMEGSLSGTIDRTGALIIEIKAPDRGFKWTGRGIVAGSRIVGQWQSSDPAAGGFTADRLD